MTQIFALLLSFFSIYSAFAETPIACTHPGVCRSIQKLVTNKTKVELLIGGGALDPHHFEPSPKEVKILTDHPLLVAAPFDLQPWPQNILKARDGSQKKTIKIFLPSNITKLYKSGAALPIEALSHYWLYPEINCDIERRLKEELVKQGVETVEENCNAEVQLKRLAALKQKYADAIFILSHNAIAPLFSRFGFQVISLKGSGHHDEIDKKAIKDLELILSQKIRRTIIWIEEENIQVPAAIIKRHRHAGHEVVKFNPEGMMGKTLDFDKTDPLDDLLAKLESLGN